MEKISWTASVERWRSTRYFSAGPSDRTAARGRIRASNCGYYRRRRPGGDRRSQDDKGNFGVGHQCVLLFQVNILGQGRTLVPEMLEMGPGPDFSTGS